MSSNTSEPKHPQQGSLQSMLARLRGMMQALKSAEPPVAEQPDLLPTWDLPGTSTGNAAPVAQATPAVAGTPELEPDHSAEAVAEPIVTGGPEARPEAPGEDATKEATATASEPAAPVAEPSAAAPAPQLCPYCQAARKGEQIYCDECGWIFPAAESAGTRASAPASASRLKDRYALGEKFGERGGVARFRGLDFGMRR